MLQTGRWWKWNRDLGDYKVHEMECTNTHRPPSARQRSSGQGIAPPRRRPGCHKFGLLGYKENCLSLELNTLFPRVNWGPAILLCYRRRRHRAWSGNQPLKRGGGTPCFLFYNRDIPTNKIHSPESMKLSDGDLNKCISPHSVDLQALRTLF